GHLGRLGGSLDSAVQAYNQTVGSLESRVLVSARRLSDLKVVDAELPSPEPIDLATRVPQAAELVDDTRRFAAGG
ncbi:MAG: DNA recombination protein RmuC, partial [Actinomycetota bacterium]|nr:DNA recombination protein RmuC [Actinomycetota bacterium]